VSVTGAQHHQPISRRGRSRSLADGPYVTAVNISLYISEYLPPQCLQWKHSRGAHVSVVNIRILRQSVAVNGISEIDPERTLRYHHGELRETLVRVAIKTIEQRGEASFTIREIAKAAGVSHAAAYRHFRSKHELLARIAEEGFYGLQASFHQALGDNAGRSCRARINALGASYIRYALQHPGYFRAMFHLELRSHNGLPSLSGAASRVFGTLVDAVTEGIARRELVRRPPQELAMVVWATIHGLSFLLLDQQIDSPPAPDELIELAIERLDAGLAHP
jgi:AcrR family transcriptional regulator